MDRIRQTVTRRIHGKGGGLRQVTGRLRFWVGWLCIQGIFCSWANSAPQAESGTYRRFQTVSISAEEAAAALRQAFPDQAGFRAFTNPQAPQELIVVGDPATLAQSELLISRLEAQPRPRSTAPQRLTTQSADWHPIPVRRTSLQRLEAAIRGLFDARLFIQENADGVQGELPIDGQTHLRFSWNWNQPVVHVAGEPQVVDQFVKLVSKLDEESDRPSDIPSVLAYHNASPISVQQILDAYRTYSGQTSLPLRSEGNQQATEAPLGNQEPLPGNPVPPNPVRNEEQQADVLRQLKDSVQVETLPDLGIIILRGRQKEVQELSRIIQELERLSAESQAEVRIVQLQHTRSDSIQKILQTTSADLISGRAGRVSLTSLGKPNALLLIGWGEALNAIEGLIHKLDQPVAPDSQFGVFRLREAEADTLLTALNSFFQNRDGLGTKVQAVADGRSNSLVVFGSPRDLSEVQRFINELDVPDFQKKHQARVVQIQNAVASELATILNNALKGVQGTGKKNAAMLELLQVDEQGQRVLESGALDEIQITPNPTTNALILSGPRESLDLVEALIQQLDVIGSTAQIKIFRIEHGDAAMMVQTLRSLMPEQSTERAPLKMSGDAQETSLAPLRFSVDSRTNSIIATGSEGDLRIIQALLLRLDEKEFSERQNLVYRLKNAPATDVAQAINNFLRSERQVQLDSAGGSSPFAQLEREVIVVPEPIGNRLILSATPRFFNEIEALIQQLDEPPPQVMIQVMIAEVMLENNREFGIELGLQSSVLFDRSLLGDLVTTTRTTQTSTPAGIVTTTEEIIQAASNKPGFDFNNQPLGNSGSTKALTNSNVVGAQGLGSFSVGRVNNELGFGGLVLSASSESISALLRALQECRRMEILSRPQIRTLDNQPAFIQVGQRVPRIIGSTVNQNGQSNAIALENVGLILGVTPRISPDGTVVMEVDAERSGLGPESEGIPVSVAPNGNIIRSPRVDTTTAQATVSAASGETIILGGLITKKTQKIERKVPWLSDIPVLSHLFRYDGSFTERAELLIILTPYVIRNRDDELRLQQMEFAKMNWCLCDIESIHGSLDGAFNPINLDSSTTQEFQPGESPILEPAPANIPERTPAQREQVPSSEDSNLMNQFEPIPNGQMKR